MSSNWKCALCEYLNSSFNSKCEMCDSPHSSFQQLQQQYESQSISNNVQQHNISQNYKQEHKEASIKSKPIEQISSPHWICEQCNGKNNNNEYFCGVCGFKKGYNPPKNNNNNNKQEIKEEIKEEPKCNYIEEKEEEESIYNYNIGDEIFYPKDYIKLENNLSLYNNYELPTNNPHKYSLGCILSLDFKNSQANITDIILNDNKTICINFQLIRNRFNIFKYNKLCIRGTSISFYNSETLNWRKGRIEYRLDNNIGIQYGNDLFIQLPIYYIKQFEELKQDEWSNVSDFVFKEYIRDIAIELIMKNKNKNNNNNNNNNNTISIEPNEFMFAMEKLGVSSAISRNKAFRLFEEIENDIILKEIRKQEEGHIIGEYKCIGICNLIKKINGIYLTNCKHSICKNDFHNILNNVVTNRAQRLLKCPKCNHEINPIDIQRHGTNFQYSIITQMQLDQVQYTFDAAKCLNCGQGNDIMDGLQQYVCMNCGTDNCLKCKSMHNCDITCDEFKMGDHLFRKQWIYDHKNNPQSKHIPILTQVNKNSNEWNDIVNHMKYSPNKVIKIERIEHFELWNKYYTYAQSLGKMLKEVRVWHGTRKTNPSLIYKNGFLKEKSRIGGCLWYAANSSYSMNGFQHPCGNGQNQLFLCLVAGGNLNHVKYIRNNKILNVYKNEATYPAYLITYK